VPLGLVHAVGAWSGEQYRDGESEVDKAVREGREIRSFQELPSVGELFVWVTTNLARTETVVEMAR
jgi:hypothetical protein